MLHVSQGICLQLEMTQQCRNYFPGRGSGWWIVSHTLGWATLNVMVQRRVTSAQRLVSSSSATFFLLSIYSTRHWTNVGSMLARRLRRRPNNDPILVQCLVLLGRLSTHHTCKSLPVSWKKVRASATAKAAATAQKLWISSRSSTAASTVHQCLQKHDSINCREQQHQLQQRHSSNSCRKAAAAAGRQSAPSQVQLTEQRLNHSGDMRNTLKENVTNLTTSSTWSIPMTTW